jgi:hypothetical protein
MGMITGEVWIHRDHPHGRRITHFYTAPDCVDEDGAPVLFVEFGSAAFTCPYAALTDLGWSRAPSPLESP